MKNITHNIQNRVSIEENNKMNEKDERNSHSNSNKMNETNSNSNTHKMNEK
jgi:hypothetical protein